MFFEAPDNILMMNAGSAFAGTMIGIAVAVIWTIGQAVTKGFVILQIIMKDLHLILRRLEA